MAEQPKPVVISARSVADRRQEVRPAPLVLVLDQDSAVRRFLEIALRELDFDACSAANASEALDIYRDGGIDMVLLDSQIPMVDALGTLAELKGIDPDVVCCFMSAHTDRADPGEILSLGARGFLPKPFKLEELRKLVLEAIRPSYARSTRP